MKTNIKRLFGLTMSTAEGIVDPNFPKKRQGMKRQLILILALCALNSSSAQTAIGTFEHVANAAAALTSDGTLNIRAHLQGNWIVADIVAVPSCEELTGICQQQFMQAGFSISDTEMIFGDYGAFGIVCGTRTLPGTWLENDDHRFVRTSFSKIFTYGITARIEKTDDGFRLLYPAEAFIGLLLRSAVILGRQDGESLSEKLRSLTCSDMQIGFHLNKKNDNRK